MKFTTVKRAVNAVHLDGDDPDQTPETHPVHGNVTFTPLLKDGDSIQVQTVNGPLTVVPTQITVRISDGVVMHRGAPGVQLFAAGPGSNPERIQWKATFHNLQSNGIPIKLKPVVFDAIPDGEVDLTTVAPLAGTPTPITRGPQGVSVDNITVEGGDLVVYARSETGVSVLSRIRMSEITDPAAAKAAADTVAKLKSALDAKADKTTVATDLNKKANKTHTHTSNDITDSASTPAAGVIVKYDSAGLFTVGTPTAAAHPATKKYVDDALAKKANSSHTHAITQVTGLQAALDTKATTDALTTGLAGKSDTTHTHSWGQVTGKPSTFTPSAHKHALADVNGLDVALEGKADTTHAHTISQVDGLATELSSRTNAWRVKAAADLAAVEKKARPGDSIYVIETGEYWEVT